MPTRLVNRVWLQSLFLFIKEFRNYTKENLPVQCFGSYFSINGLIFARPSLDCNIFNALSVNKNRPTPVGSKSQIFAGIDFSVSVDI